MGTERDQEESEARAAGQFTTTHWSVVLTAGEGGSPEAAKALERLCRAYWYPLYAYVRRRGYNREDAQDLTQSFFAHLLGKGFPSGIEPGKGRFRSFLLVCLNHLLTDQREKACAAKRGGADPGLPLNWVEAEERYRLETPLETTPEHLYDRRWAIDLLDHVLERLRQEALASGQDKLFEAVEGCLLGGRADETYARIGDRLGLSETAVKVAVYRLRQRYRELVREEIAHTVTHPEQIDEEMHYLFEVVSR
ncbi:MAG: sigma-70 family RNA polymerase sigma factor [Verrucomicrobia bacterium]|nr:sigma-70 family RNA polymerase sigma factor [Verrucomicrobiota bacterium]